MRRATADCLIILGLLAAGCGAGEPEGGDGGAAIALEQEGAQLPAGFADFYERFHADSAFQIAHVSFPLAGRVIADTTAGGAREGFHEADDWRIHRPLTLGSDFARELEVVDEGLVFETIRTRVGNYRIERRFARLGEEWNLIYYRESTL